MHGSMETIINISPRVPGKENSSRSGICILKNILVDEVTEVYIIGTTEMVLETGNYTEFCHINDTLLLSKNNEADQYLFMSSRIQFEPRKAHLF